MIINIIDMDVGICKTKLLSTSKLSFMYRNK